MDIMKKSVYSALAALGLLVSCNTVDNSLGDKVYTCDATSTVLEYCQEEAGTDANLEPSKSTCKDVKGAWSDTERCPTNYTKKCKEGDKISYFYAQDDANKSCAELNVGLLLAGQSSVF
jgi:hypothetical protein